jgi:hypothetical protein
VGSRRGAGVRHDRGRGPGPCGGERGVGASGGGSGSGSAMPTCRAGKDAQVGVRLGKETDVWATFRGCGPIALGQPEGIVLFFYLFKNFSNGFESIRSKDDFPEFKKYPNKIWSCRELNKEQFSLLELSQIRNRF